MGSTEARRDATDGLTQSIGQAPHNYVTRPHRSTLEREPAALDGSAIRWRRAILLRCTAGAPSDLARLRFSDRCGDEFDTAGADPAAYAWVWLRVLLGEAENLVRVVPSTDDRPRRPGAAVADDLPAITESQDGTSGSTTREGRSASTHTV